MTADLLAFLNGCLDDDERQVRFLERDGAWLCTRCNGEMNTATRLDEHLFADHGVREWGPARVLAEVDAKRRILDVHFWAVEQVEPDEETTECVSCGTAYPCQTVRLLALPFADRPGYDEDWAPKS
jgi:hypothetical protein